MDYLHILVVIIALHFSDVDCQDCNGVVVGNTCYTVWLSAKTWRDAEADCRSRQGHLAPVSNQNQQDAVENLLGRFGINAAWIGGSYHTQQEWRWLNTNSILSPQGCYTDVIDNRDLPFEIKISNMNPEKCIQRCKEEGYLYAGTQGGVLCFCGDSFGRYGTNKVCTRECRAPSNISNWCGGMLMNFVYRIGGSYGNWGYHQPNNHQGNQNCGIIDTSIETKMADENCNTLLASMCEVDLSPCPDRGDRGRYMALNGHCYYLNETRVPWGEAELSCQGMTGGGALINMEVQIQHHRVRNMTDRFFPYAQKIWVGLRKYSGWQWTAEPAFSYKHWAPNYPTGANNTCVQTTRSDNWRWTDTDCINTRFYLCSNALNSGVTTTTPSGGGSTTKSSTLSSRTTTTTPSGGGSTTRSTTTTSRRTPTASSGGGEATGTPTPGGATTKAGGDVTGPTTETTSLVPPSQGASVEQMSATSIALYVLLALLLLALLILLIACLVVRNMRSRNKVKNSYDARPIAPVPNSGNTPDYYKYASTLDLRSHGPY